MKQRLFLTAGFIMSYLPLWIIVCFECIVSVIGKNQSLCTEWLTVWIVVPIVLCSYLVFSAILQGALDERGLRYKIVETKQLKGISSEYLLSYVIPLIAFDFTHWQDMIKFSIIWGFLFLLCWHFWQMPIACLSMLGFFVSECELETNDGQLVQKVVISRNPLSRIKGEMVMIVDIDNNQAIQTGEFREHLEKK